MANSAIAFDRVMTWEGYTIECVAGDPGGETMAGITRKYEGDWSGWKYVDAIKGMYGFAWGVDESHKKQVMHDCIASRDIKNEALKYYDSLFRQYLLNQLQSQVISNQIFQAVVNCGPRAVIWAQEVANTFPNLFPDLETDGEIGGHTVSALNLITVQHETDYTNAFADRQIEYYETRVQRSPSMSKFLLGWKQRANDFRVKS